MNVLIACECSQTVCIEFRKLGFNAFSCDIEPALGGHPEWHIWENVKDVLCEDFYFYTMDNVKHYVKRWDLIIAHPPCTYLSNASACRMFPGGKLDPKRFDSMIHAREFFYVFLDAVKICNHIAIENPTPLKICNLPKPNQVIQPYYFGEPYSKRTCFWLRGLPPLFYTFYIPEHVPYIGGSPKSGAVNSQYMRSKTFPGIAIAMAEQWGDFVLKDLRV